MAVILPDLIHEALIPSLTLVETALLLFNLTVVFANSFVVAPDTRPWRSRGSPCSCSIRMPVSPSTSSSAWHIYSKQRFRLKVRDDLRVRAYHPAPGA